MFDITEAVKTLFLQQPYAVYICTSYERIRHLKEKKYYNSTPCR